MTDQDQQQEPTIREILASAHEVVDSEPVEAESVAKPDTSSGQAAADAVQKELEVTPSSHTPAEFAKAIQLIGRASGKFGSEPISIVGKSEAEVIALATEFDTLMREADSEHGKSSQGESTGSASSDQGSQAAGPDGEAGVGAPAATTATPDAPVLALTSLRDEGYEEEADQLEAAFAAQAAQLSALTARLDSQEQARQAAPVIKAVEDVVAGYGDQIPDLSQPQRAALANQAQLLISANPDQYKGMGGPEKAATSMRAAIQATYGLGAPKAESKAQPRRRATAEGPSSGRSRGFESKPETIQDVLRAGYGT